MKRLALQCGILGLFSLLALTVGAAGQRTAYAQSPIIGQTMSSFFVLNTWQDSKVTLLTNVVGAPTQTDVQISDQSYLRIGWTVKVDQEKMCVEQLVEGGYGQPDHMIVERGYPCQGSPTLVASHTAGTTVQAHTVTVDVLAQNVPGPEGLGGFEVRLTLPPETEYIKGVVDTTWLTSTGRTDPWCDSFALIDGSWVARCSTLNPTPNGPTGTGVVAHVTVLPPQELGVTVISVAGSQLANIKGDNLQAAPADLRINMIGCPDANLDGRVSIGDLTITSRTLNARGENSLATLSSGITASDTQIPISQVGLLQLNDSIALDAELMTVQAINPSPPSITVARAQLSTSAHAHNAGTIIYRGTYPNNVNGTYNYTWPRDPNHDYRVTVSDLTVMARVSGIFCPTD
jgi:hypothetical protein